MSKSRDRGTAPSSNREAAQEIRNMCLQLAEQVFNSPDELLRQREDAGLGVPLPFGSEGHFRHGETAEAWLYSMNDVEAMRGLTSPRTIQIVDAYDVWVEAIMKVRH